jgi:short-subunit dehydrogenase
VLVARRGDRLREIADRYDDFEVLEADLGTSKGQKATVKRIQSTIKPVDLVVNNAGFGTSGVFHELDVDRLAGEIELNVAALTVLSHAALAAMVPRRRGYLLNVSSVVSFQASPGLGVYAATKAYVTSLTEALHAEVKSAGIHVTALCPGLTSTEFQDHSNTTGLASRVPDLAWTSVEQVASTGLNDVASNKTISVPGALYKTAVTFSDIMPRSITRWVTGSITR